MFAKFSWNITTNGNDRVEEWQHKEKDRDYVIKITKEGEWHSNMNKRRM